MKQFIHLRCHTNYSVGEGLLKINKLLDKCLEHQFPAIAITDTGNMFGVREFSSKMVSQSIQPIIGFQILVQYEKTLGNVVLLAKNLQGYQNLLQLHKLAYQNKVKNKLEFPTINFNDLLKFASNTVLLTGGIDGILANMINKAVLESKIDEILNILKQHYQKDLYIELNRFFTIEDNLLEKKFLKLAEEKSIPIVATNNVTFLEKEDYEIADILLCIGQGVPQKEEKRKKAFQHSYFKSSEDMIALFQDLPEAIDNTVYIAQKCCFFINKQPLALPQFNDNEQELIIQEANDGLKHRLKQEVYPNLKEQSIEATLKRYQERLNFELKVIIKMDFCGYFLIVSDFIKWAKMNNIPVGPGRGSGAGSLVAWSLSITDINPLKFNLLFERFLNPERISMPDFDIDFCHDHRDDVVDYVKNKYGADKVAHIITFGTLQVKAAIKDVGRVMSLSYSEVDLLTKKIPYSPPSVTLNLGKILSENVALQADMKEHSHIKRLFDVALKVEGMYRNISTHAAGVVISKKPLVEIVPLFYDSEDNLASVGFSMKFLEDVGLVKFDFLALKALTIIKDTVDSIEKNEKIKINVLNISNQDDEISKLLAQGETLGVFQLESRGMIDVIKQLKPDRIEDIIAIISLYRPGPMENIPLYIHNKKSGIISSLHPKMTNILAETYGIMIYQEQVMQVAQIIAGYTLGGADILRRAMGKKDPIEMQKQRAVFITGAKTYNNIDSKLAEQIFDLMEKFAGYGFNKSHATAYALISWQTAFLKVHYPIEFLASSMSIDSRANNKLGERFLEFIEEAKRYNIVLLTPSINRPALDFTIEVLDNTKSIRYSLLALKGVGKHFVEVLITEVIKGKFTSIENFLERIDSKFMNKKQLEALIKSGAFDDIYSNRHMLFANLETMIQFNRNVYESKNSNQISLFDVQESKNILTLTAVEDWDIVTKSAYELEIANYFLSEHPLEEFNDILKQQKVDSYKHVIANKKRKALIVGYLMKISSSKSKTGKLFANLTFYDKNSIFNISLFGNQYEKHIGTLIEHKCYMLRTVAKIDEHGMKLFIDSIEELQHNSLKLSKKIKAVSNNQNNNTHNDVDNNDVVEENKNDMPSHVLASKANLVEIKLEHSNYLSYLKNICINDGLDSIDLQIKANQQYLKYKIANIQIVNAEIEKLSAQTGIEVKIS